MGLGQSSVGNVIVSQAQGPKFDYQNPRRKCQAWWHIFVISVLEMWKQKGPWRPPWPASLGYLASSRLGTHTTSCSQTSQVTLWPLCACAPAAALACVFAMWCSSGVMHLLGKCFLRSRDLHLGQAGWPGIYKGLFLLPYNAEFTITCHHGWLFVQVLKNAVQEFRELNHLPSLFLMLFLPFFMFLVCLCFIQHFLSVSSFATCP